MSDDTLAKITGAVAVSMFIIGIIVGFTRGDTALREEAIQAGHAEWVADTSGKAQFKWKECK
jgi:preprotein translocase subunit SecG